MELSYDNLDTRDLRGSTLADFLIAIDADLRFVVDNEVVLEEPGFPVVELARTLKAWLTDPEPREFEFESMSYEERGSLRIKGGEGGWVVGSILDPAVSIGPLVWHEVVAICQRLVSRVESDLADLGLDVEFILGS